MLEDTSLSSKFSSEKFRTQDVVTHTIQAIESFKSSRTQSVTHIVFVEKKKVIQNVF